MLFRQDGPSLVVHTPAKLNLFLEVLAKRPDGYHELETLMVSVGIYDTLSFTEQEDSDEIRLRCFQAGSRGSTRPLQPAEVPGGRENLAVRAAHLLKDRAGVGRGVRIDLHKRIPVAAGLAGGSSDAAATLAALNRLWGLNLPAGELQELASQLGSDVSFFLERTSAAVCRGRGEVVEPLRLPLGLYFVIARPRSGLSTAVVFRHCTPAEHPRSVGELVRFLSEGRLGRAAGLMYNALQAPAETLNAELSELKSRFLELTVLSHLMSGSGTAWFGLCANRRQALAAAARLRAMQTAHVFVAQAGP